MKADHPGNSPLPVLVMPDMNKPGIMRGAFLILIMEPVIPHFYSAIVLDWVHLYAAL